MSTIELPKPAWLVAALDQLLARLDQTTGGALATLGFDVVLIPLTEPPENATPQEHARWEYTCDNCGLYSKEELRTGTVGLDHHGLQLVVGLGACQTCWRLP